MHLSTHLLQNLLATWGYLAVFILVSLESSGIPLPGETMLVLAAIYAGTGHMNIVAVIATAAAAAIAGDNTGYLVGRTGGRELILRHGGKIGVTPERLQVAESFFARHGDKTVFLGRFVAVLRAWAAFLAGVNRMPWPKFLLFNAAGGILWSILYGTLAFELGKNLPLLDKVRKVVGFGGIGIAVAVAIVLFILHRRGVHLLGRVEEQREERDTGTGEESQRS